MSEECNPAEDKLFLAEGNLRYIGLKNVSSANNRSRVQHAEQVDRDDLHLGGQRQCSDESSELKELDFEGKHGSDVNHDDYIHLAVDGARPVRLRGDTRLPQEFASLSSSVPAFSPLRGSSNTISPFGSCQLQGTDMATPSSYYTAMSSVASSHQIDSETSSYATAPSVPRSSWRVSGLRNISQSEPSDWALKMAKLSLFRRSGSIMKPNTKFENLVDQITTRIPTFTRVLPEARKVVKQSLWILQYCGPSIYRQSERSFTDETDPQSGITIEQLNSDYKKTQDPMSNSGDCDALMRKLFRDFHKENIFLQLHPMEDGPLRAELALCIRHYISGASLDAGEMPGQTFGSKWLEYLNERGILLGPMDELNWSGRGQHIEYNAGEESQIPLEPKKVLGHSSTAIIESVQCRRITLARKTVNCDRRFTKENVLDEVEHLQRLQNSHIVRLVGTYTLRRTLAILMYPAADTNLEDFMDDISQEEHDDCGNKLYSIKKFFGCLSTAMSFIHSKNVKHMDIKPKNILVRRFQEGYKVYIADFGIAKAYRSAAESFTDSPTAFTRTYAAPEVVMQDTRGYPADIFSLGCVFMEMYASLASTSSLNYKKQLLEVRGTEYHNHITEVIAWYRSTSGVLIERYQSLPVWSQDGLRTWEVNGNVPEMFNEVPEMLNETPSLRPSADSLKRITAYLGCSVCDSGPEPFEAAERQVGGL